MMPQIFTEGFHPDQPREEFTVCECVLSCPSCQGIDGQLHECGCVLCSEDSDY